MHRIYSVEAIWDAGKLYAFRVAFGTGGRLRAWDQPNHAEAFGDPWVISHLFGSHIEWPQFSLGQRNELRWTVRIMSIHNKISRRLRKTSSCLRNRNQPLQLVKWQTFAHLGKELWTKAKCHLRKWILRTTHLTTGIYRMNWSGKISYLLCSILLLQADTTWTCDISRERNNFKS